MISRATSDGAVTTALLRIALLRSFGSPIKEIFSEQEKL
jgi:hypothetical protein